MRLKRLVVVAVFAAISVICLNHVIGYGQNVYKKDYEKLTSYYADIYYGAGCEDYAYATMRIADAYYPYLMAEFEVYEDTRAEMVIHWGKEAMYGAMEKDYGEKPPMGAYYRGVIHILSPRVWGYGEALLSDRFLEEGPVIHELSHFMLDKKTGGNYEIWFSEGVALYMEYKYMAYEWKAETADCDNISYMEMKEYFKESNQGSAYRMAFELVKKLGETHGKEVFADIYTELAKGKPFDEVMKGY